MVNDKSAITILNKSSDNNQKIERTSSSGAAKYEQPTYISFWSVIKSNLKQKKTCYLKLMGNFRRKIMGEERMYKYFYYQQLKIQCKKSSSLCSKINFESKLSLDSIYNPVPPLVIPTS